MIGGYGWDSIVGGQGITGTAAGGARGDGYGTAGLPGAPAPAPSPTDGGAEWGGGGGGGFGGVSSGGLSSGPQFNFGETPVFAFDDFTAPSFDSVKNDPGYQFRALEGQKALERAAAAKGVLRTGGTLKDLMTFGQNMASQEYAQAYDRALKGYDTNRQTRLAEFAPQFQAWQTLANAERARGMAAFQREFDVYSMANANSQRQADRAHDVVMGLPSVPVPPMQVPGNTGKAGGY